METEIIKGVIEMYVCLNCKEWFTKKEAKKKYPRKGTGFLDPVLICPACGSDKYEWGCDSK